MGKNTGFLEYNRAEGPVRPEAERILDFREFHGSLPREKQMEQAARCMDCGIPFCQAGCMIGGMSAGCPLQNLIPEINDLVYRGRMEEAYVRLSVTHPFPEFTARVCPALCEAACTCGLHDEPVSTKENERAVMEYAFANGLVESREPAVRTGKRIAVIGSGPAGLSAAFWLNSRGHEVCVYERSDRIGGLLRYGIPNMKLEKALIDRRVEFMERSGIRFAVNTDVGKDRAPSELIREYDSLILACGASKPRDISVPGREAKGIYFAVDFLSRVTKTLLDSDFQKIPYELCKDKDVLVIGGGDTGNDCVGTSLRLQARSVTQLEMMPKPPEVRLISNPWPEWPRVLKTDYGQQEAISLFGKDPRVYQTTVKEFLVDKQGNLKGAVLLSLTPKKDEATGRLMMVPVPGSEKKVKTQLVLIAAGFLGPEDYVSEAFGVELDPRTNVKTQPEGYQTSRKGIYTAGDMHTGQSLVVKAIAEGKKAARAVDKDLMGYTNL